MNEPNRIPSQPVVLSVSCPGGIAQQFRVQVEDRTVPAGWRLAASFRDRAAAGQCAERLIAAGQSARVVECRALPTAA